MKIYIYTLLVLLLPLVSWGQSSQSLDSLIYFWDDGQGGKAIYSMMRFEYDLLGRNTSIQYLEEEYDDNGNPFLFKEDRTDYAWDAKERLVHKDFYQGDWDSNTWEFGSRKVYYYNPLTGLKDSVVQSHRDSASNPIWTPFRREYFWYDSLNRLVADTIYKQQNGSNTWELDEGTNYVYFGTGLDYESSFIYKDYSTWPPTLSPGKSQAYFNPDGKILSSTYIMFDSVFNSWFVTNERQSTYTPDGKLASDLYKYYDRFSAQGNKTIYRYDVAGDLEISHRSNWDDSTSSWIESPWRRHHQLDRTNGKYIGRDEHFDSFSNRWNRDSAKYEIAYDMSLTFEELRLPYQDEEDGFLWEDGLPNGWPEVLHIGKPINENWYDYSPATQQYTTNGDEVAYRYSPAIGVGIPNIERSQLRVFPNPAQDKIQIKLPHSIEPTQLEIYDQQGRLVHQQELASHREIISIRHLPAGAYFLKAIQGDKLLHAKILKHK